MGVSNAIISLTMATGAGVSLRRAIQTKAVTCVDGLSSVPATRFGLLSFQRVEDRFTPTSMQGHHNDRGI